MSTLSGTCGKLLVKLECMATRGIKLAVTMYVECFMSKWLVHETTNSHNDYA